MAGKSQSRMLPGLIEDESVSTLDAYCDGGVIGRNPSPRGGTWAWCLVDGSGKRMREDSGVVLPADVGLPVITNNLTELLAALLALEALPEGWEGTLFTDSRVTQCRVTKKIMKKSGSPAMNGIPLAMQERVALVKRRLGGYRVRLLGGHPTPEELAAGSRSDGAICSIHNVYCDEACNQQAEFFR